MAADKPLSDKDDRPAGMMTRLAGTRAVTAATIAFERLWPLALPVLIVLCLFAATSWFGLFRLMPDWLRIATVAAFGVGALAALYPLRWFVAPRRDEIDRRIELHNQLVHTPIQVQADRLSGSNDHFAEALWREHQRRMARKLAGLSSDMPRTRVPERDPWGLRAVAALLVVTAFAFSVGPFGGSLLDGFRAAPGAPPVPPRVDAWVTPPAYTGRPPIFLTADANRTSTSFEAPQGSDVTLRVTGGAGDETLTYAPAAGEARMLEPDAGAEGKPVRAGVRNFAGKLDADGTLALKSGETELMRWAFKVIPDTAPTIKFLGEPKRAVNGTLELAYSIQDDYGAASGKAEFEQVEPQAADARPLYEAPDMPLTLPRRNAKEGAAKTSRDLTEHVWAGIEVRARLKAADAAGQEAVSETKTFRMPERPFSNPLARAVVEQRRILGLDANRKARVLDLMDAVMLRPEDTIPNSSHWLALSSARSRLQQATTDEQLREVADYMWEIALGIEDGDLSAAEKALRQAQEALKNALQNGASEEEIARLMDELRKAMDNYLREFAERAQRDPNMAQQMPRNGQELRQSDLDKMLDRIEELAKSGARDQAQELLSQLQDMMNNLQAGRQQQQQGQNGQQSEMRKQMDKLGQLMRRQQEMMNETHRLDQMQRGQRQPNEDYGEQLGEMEGQEGQQGEQGQGQNGQMSEQELADALRGMQQGQQGLRGELESLMKGLEGMGIKPGEGFGEAGEAMGEAGRQLGQAQGEEAVGEQGRALEALRKGAQDMMQQMQQAMQGEQGGSEEGGRQQNADRDPLGRPRATTGPDFGDTVKVPDEIDVQRAREILDAIRKRLGNALSPEIEKDYLERLLKMQ